MRTCPPPSAPASGQHLHLFHVGEAEVPGNLVSEVAYTMWLRSHQVHIVERTDASWWDRHAVFRCWLRTHPEDVGAYAALKRELATTHRNDRRAGKAPSA